MKIKMMLTDKNGETIMESIVSLMVFAVLMVAVTTMIVTSMRITSHSVERAREVQKNINDMVLENFEDANPDLDYKTGSITFSGAGVYGVTHEIDVLIDGNNKIISFAPQG